MSGILPLTHLYPKLEVKRLDKPIVIRAPIVPLQGPIECEIVIPDEPWHELRYLQHGDVSADAGARA